MNLREEIRQAIINSSRLLKILKSTLDKLSDKAEFPLSNEQFTTKIMKNVEEEFNKNIEEKFNVIHYTPITYSQDINHNCVFSFPADFLISKYFRLIIPILYKKNKKSRYVYEIFDRIPLCLMGTTDVSFKPFDSVAILNLSDYLAINLEDEISLTKNIDLLYYHFLFYNVKEINFRVENKGIKSDILTFKSLGAYLFSHEAYGYAKEVANSPDLATQQHLLETIQLNEIYTEKDFTFEEFINCIEDGSVLIITNETILSDITDTTLLHKFNIVSLNRLSSLITLVDFQKYISNDKEIRPKRWASLNECLVDLDYNFIKNDITYTLNLKKSIGPKAKSLDLSSLNRFINNGHDIENIKKFHSELNDVLFKANINVEIVINIASINYLGDCYYYGIDVTQDYKQAAYWYQKATELGNKEIQNKIIICYCQLGNNYYNKKDYEQAIEWYQKAINLGYTEIQNNFIDCYYQLGNNCYNNKDYEQAIEWYQKAEKQGYTKVQDKIANCYYQLGDSYYNNDDFNQAIKWYQKAEKHGYVKAQNKIADCYYQLGNSCYNNENFNQAIKWYQKILNLDYDEAQKKIVDCYNNLGNSCYSKEEYKKAVYWWQKALELGNTKAQNKISNCYLQLGNNYYSKEDYQQAEKYWLKAIELGNLEAQYKLDYNKLGDKSYNKKDYQQAVYWYQKAIELGNTEVQNKIGDCYNKIGDSYYNKKDYQQASNWYQKALEQGHIIDQNKVDYCNKILQEDVNNLVNAGLFYYLKHDYENAIYYYRKAAELGNAEAQNSLGSCYELIHDYTQAEYWWLMAAAQGNTCAQLNLMMCNTARRERMWL